MAKDPAFLFYPNDWIGGTMGMTFEEKGAYVELLMLQFNRGHMTKHMIARTIGQLWVKIEDKFRMDKEGLYYNVRLDKEKEKRENFTKSRRNNIVGKNQHTNKVGHMTNHMENVNIDTNNIVNSMLKIFKKYNPSYPEDTQKDFTSCFSIAAKIGKSKGWEQHHILNGKQPEILKSWETIVNFIVSDKWFSTRALFDINTEWQRLIQSMNSSKNIAPKEQLTSVKKESDTNFDKYLKPKK